LLTEISKKLATVGIDPAGSIYIADSALVCEKNFDLIGDETLFISRLPATFGEHQRLIDEAVQSESWDGYGILASTAPTRNRPGVHYHGFRSDRRDLHSHLRVSCITIMANDQSRAPVVFDDTCTITPARSCGM
jgi:hypothetical protein